MNDRLLTPSGSIPPNSTAFWTTHSYRPTLTVEGENSPVYKIAATPEERRDAFRLVYRSYVSAGLARPNMYQLRVTPYHLLPTTQVFIAVDRQRVISTLTLIMDGDRGLPMESMYPSEVDDRRAGGLVLAEVSCLAERWTRRVTFLEVFRGLTRVMIQYARRQGVQQLLIVCHPRHKSFYQRYFGFHSMGGITACPHVQNRPAMALCVDLEYIDENPPGWYQTLFGETIPDEQLAPHAIQDEERLFLSRMIDICFHPLGPSVGTTRKRGRPAMVATV